MLHLRLQKKNLKTTLIISPPNNVCFYSRDVQSTSAIQHLHLATLSQQGAVGGYPQQQEKIDSDYCEPINMNHRPPPYSSHVSVYESLTIDDTPQPSSHSSYSQPPSYTSHSQPSSDSRPYSHSRQDRPNMSQHGRRY